MESRMELGKIVNTVGLKGEIRVWPYIDYFDKVKKVYINGKEHEIERTRNHKNVVIIKLKDINTIDEAESLKDMMIEMERKDAPSLPEGIYYINDLIGFEVYSDDGKFLGTLDDIFNTGANDIYQVGDILLPAIKDVIKQIDTDNQKIIIHLIDGLI
jgi:16S rRNA processing protein RimM